MRKILSILLSIVCLICFTTNVNAASSTISANRTGTEYEYIDGLPIYYNKASSYSLYVLDSNTYFENSTTLRDPEEIDGGFKYILNNSNPTSSSDRNYYITQVAILWYQDYLNGNDNNISTSMKNYISSHTSDTTCYYINKLVKSAKDYSDNSDSIIIKDNEVTFEREGNYYYSNEIEVETNNLYSTPTVNLHNAPSSSKIVNNSLSKNGSGTFQVRIPVSSLNSYYEDDFEINVSGRSDSYEYYMYSNYGTDRVIYARSYNSDYTNVEDSLIAFIKGTDKTRVRIIVFDEDGNYIKNIKYSIYEGNCKDTACKNTDLVHTFTTSSSYTTLENILNAGTYTLVRKTNSSKYDLNEKEVFEVRDTTTTQEIVIEEGNYNNNSYNSKNVKIINPLNDSSNVIKIYKTNGSLVDSFRANVSNYEINLLSGYYYLIDSDNTIRVDFQIYNGYLLVKVGSNYVEKDNLDLEKYFIVTPQDITNNNNNNDNNNDDYYVDENGNIHIDNLDGVDSIDISNKVTTTTDVKVDWISNIIDCPQTSISSTIKYVVGAIILALGTILIVKNVKKSKNNI